MFTMPVLRGGAFVVDGQLWENVVALLAVGATQATAAWQMKNNGQNLANGVPPNTDWFDPLTAGVGANHWVRATLLSGSVPNGGDPLNTWIAISTEPSWSNTTTGMFVVRTRQSTLKIEIAADALGAVILGTNTLYIEATVDNS